MSGETYTAFKLLKCMAPELRLTILAFQCRYGPPLEEQMPEAEVVTFREPDWAKTGNLVRLFKPLVPYFHWRVSRWVHRALDEGRKFDLAHQILPRAPRYASPLRNLGIPYIIGSLGGALQTPPGFRGEVSKMKWYTQLRDLDRFRFRYDPFLRASYSKAERVLGVAPYMQDILGDVPMRSFSPVPRHRYRLPAR